MRTIFFDVDTQLDFLYPAGALYVPGAEEIVARVAGLNAFAAARQIKILSSKDAHSENDPEFKQWKPHCVASTVGQMKAHGTRVTLEDAILTALPGALDAVRHKIDDVPQIVIEKQQIDCFSNANLGPLLELLGGTRYVLYGVVTEYCVREAALALLALGAQVTVVTDAIKGLSAVAEKETLDLISERGGERSTYADIIDNHRGL